MKNFVNYEATGVVYERNKRGKAVRVLRAVYCSGVARLDRGLIGTIHRQNPDLLPCDDISVSYSEL